MGENKCIDDAVPPVSPTAVPAMPALAAAVKSAATVSTAATAECMDAAIAVNGIAGGDAVGVVAVATDGVVVTAVLLRKPGVQRSDERRV